MKKFLALLLVLAMVVSLVACGQSEDPEPSTEPDPTVEYDTEANLVYGITSKWNTLNFYAGAPTAAIFFISEKIFDRLWYIKEDGTIDPRNAETWEWNDDFTQLTIQLNQNAKWSDGQPVTAADWEFTFTTMATKEAGWAKPSNNRFFVGTDSDGWIVEGEEFGVKATGDYTLVMSFKQNMLSLANFFSKTTLQYTPVIPKHILGSLAIDQIYTDASYWDAPIGSGPCTLVSHTVNSEVVLQARSDYYLGTPGFKTLTFKYMDAATSLAALKTGEIDVVYPRYNGDNALEAIDAAKSGAYTAEMDSTCTRLCILIINNKTIADAEIRQAIQYTIDRTALCSSIMGGTAVPTATYVSDGNPYKKTDIDISQNLDKAKEILTRKGYTTDNPLELKMDVVAGYREKIGAYMQQELAKVGIKLTVTTKDASTGFSEVSSGAVDMAWIMESWDDSNLKASWYYLANQKGSYTNVTDTSFTEMMANIEELEKGTDTEALKEAMYDWQDYIYEQAAIIPVFFMHSVSACSNRLVEARLFDTGGYNDNVWQWKVTK